MNKSRRNLIILGCASVLIALITSGVSLVVYHNSGDIYLDRSRPGFLPEKKEEEKKEKEEEYKFEDNGKITDSSLKEYLNYYNEAVKYLEKLEDPFSVSSLSDESLGL